MINLDKTEMEYEEKIKNYAVAMIKEIENRSKMFTITVNNVANILNVRKQHWRRYC